MDERAAIKVGILADTNEEVAVIRQLISMTSNEIAYARAISTADNFSDHDAQVWIVCVQDCDNENYENFVEFADESELPVIYDDFSYLKSENRQASSAALGQKISSSVGVRSLSRKAKEVWVLGASAGGPEAVGEFLQALKPCEQLCDIAFLYAQHISAAAIPVLIRGIKQQCDLPIEVCDQAHQLAGGTLYLVHPEQQIEFNDYGTVTPVPIPWQGQFSPTIDQVMARVARSYGERSGAIIFSGMSNDGAASCRYMQHLGGAVWAQSPDSCAVNSMPVSAIASRCVSVSGDPKLLAEKFLARVSQRQYVSRPTVN